MKYTKAQEKEEITRVVRAHRDFTYKKVLERDADKFGVVRCVRCGKPYDEIHEINPKGRATGLEQIRYYTRENCCAICIPCHSIAHTKKVREELCIVMKKAYGYEYRPDFYPIYKSISELLRWSGVKSEVLNL